MLEIKLLQSDSIVASVFIVLCLSVVSNGRRKNSSDPFSYSSSPLISPSSSSFKSPSSSSASSSSGIDAAKFEECPKSLDHCSKEMRSILNDTRFTFAQNDHQLDILCLHLNRTITCINKFIECDTMSNLKKDTFNGSFLLMDKLCSKSSKFRTDYLKHAECYHKLAPVYKKCYQLYYESEKQRIELNTNITNNQHLILWCCNYKNHRKCTTDPVRRSCGSDAADLAKQIVIITEGLDALDHCPKHIISSPTCLKQWESLGLLVNTTYNSNGNIDFLSNDYSFLFPDRISSTSGSLSSLVIKRYQYSKEKLIGKLIPLSSTVLLQLTLALTGFILMYSDFDSSYTLPIRLSFQSTFITPSPSPLTSQSLSSPSISNELPTHLPTLPKSSNVVTLRHRFLTRPSSMSIITIKQSKDWAKIET